MNVETASRNRMSIREVGSIPFFHANMYLHLQVQQVIKAISFTEGVLGESDSYGDTNCFKRAELDTFFKTSTYEQDIA